MIEKIKKSLLSGNKEALKKFGIIRLVLLIFSVLMLAYISQPYRQTVHDKSKEGVLSDEKTGGLGVGFRGNQHFKFTDSVTLNSVDIRFDTVGGTVNTDYVSIYILEVDTKNELVRRHVKTSRIKDYEPTRVNFKDGVQLKGGKGYQMIVTGPEIKEGVIAPEVYLSHYAAPNKSLYIKGSLVRNQALAVTYNYSYDDSFNVLGFQIVAIIFILLLLVPFRVLKGIGRSKIIGWAWFAINPYVIYHFSIWYQRLIYRNEFVWQYSCLLLLMVQLILYAVFANKYVVMLLTSALCFLLTVINGFIALFRGNPVTPADIFSWKTALEVSDQYVIDFTHTQLHFLGFMAIYILGLLMIGTYKRPAKQAKREKGWLYVIWNLLKKLVRWIRKKAGKAEAIEQEKEKETSPSSKPIMKVIFGAIWRFIKGYWYMGVKTALRVAFVIVAITQLGVLYNTDALAVHGIVPNVWDGNYSVRVNGIYLNFFMNTHYLTIKKPEDYNINQVAKLVDEHTESVTGQANQKDGFVMTKDQSTSKKKQPNVIIIMNESLADYTILNHGDVMTYNKDYLPYIHSLNENVQKGKCYVSVYGGGTANSEWECLTGNSMAFMPSGSIAYQQFTQDTTFSIPLYLRELGYKTTAIHPCAGTNWNRYNVYDSMGFDEFIVQSDFKNPQTIRYVSDKEVYKKIISKFKEKKPEDNQFVMAITMQNHGGYDEMTDWKDPIVAGDGSYSKANEYLSSAHVSDQAYKYLINYFKDYDEPTIILMWGDHQPSIDPEFVDTVLGTATYGAGLNEAQERYCTPYILWANYELSETTTTGVTSNNFLSNMVFKEAGIPLARYNQYVDQVHEKVQAMNSFGYMTKDHMWHLYEEKTDATKLLKDYNVMEYGYYADKKQQEIAELFELPIVKKKK